MTHQIKYCKNCGIEYSFQASGEGIFEQLVTEAYCLECSESIKEVKEEARKLMTKYNKQMVEILDEIGQKATQSWKVTDKVEFNKLFDFIKENPDSSYQSMSGKTMMLECTKRYKYDKFNEGTFRCGIIDDVPTVEGWTYTDLETDKSKLIVKQYVE